MRDRYFTILNEERGGEPPDLTETHTLINHISDKRVWLFSVLSYIFAGRIQEIIRFKPPLYKYKKNKKTKKTIKIPNPNLDILPGLRRKDFHIQEYVNDLGINHKFLVCTLRNLKNRKVHNKRLFCRIDKEEELIKPFMKHLESLNDEDIILDWSRSWMSKLFKDYAGETLYHPHFLRGLRLTHLVIYYGFNEQLLVNFAGWSDGRPAKNYMMFAGKALMEQLSR